MLQGGVDSSNYVLSRHGLFVQGSVVVAGLNLVFGVSQIDAVALFSAKIIFAAGFYASLSGIVSGTILVRVLFDVVSVNL